MSRPVLAHGPRQVISQVKTTLDAREILVKRRGGELCETVVATVALDAVSTGITTGTGILRAKTVQGILLTVKYENLKYHIHTFPIV